MRPLDDYIKNQLDKHLCDIGNTLNANAMSIISPIVPGLDIHVREAIGAIQNKKKSIAIIHDTPGGVVEVVERIVTAIRHYYSEVIIIVPDRAMSAGTILALSADRILMDYFSCLGPIDPQIEKGGRLIPALSYLEQFNRLNIKAQKGSLTSAEYALLSKLDLGELYQFEQAKELSIELLEKWLSIYKFKNRTVTETRKAKVTKQKKAQRAKEIAKLLNNSSRWHSHGRGIDMRTLTDEIGLKIEDFSKIKDLEACVREYFMLLKDYMQRQEIRVFIHTEGYF